MTRKNLPIIPKFTSAEEYNQYQLEKTQGPGKPLFKKGIAPNPKGKPKGTRNYATTQFLGLREQASDDAPKVYKLLMEKLYDGTEWAFKIFFGHLYHIPKRKDRALQLPKLDVDNMTLDEYSQILLKTLMKFDDYTYDEMVGILRTLNGVKLNEVIKEQAPGLSREELAVLLGAVDTEINKIKEKQKYTE